MVLKYPKFNDSTHYNAFYCFVATVHVVYSEINIELSNVFHITKPEIIIIDPKPVYSSQEVSNLHELDVKEAEPSYSHFTAFYSTLTQCPIYRTANILSCKCLNENREIFDFI